MAQKQRQIDTSRLLAVMSEIQRDLRDQVAMCTPFLKNYNQPVVVLSRERLRKNAKISKSASNGTASLCSKSES